ncbi:MAG: hypothetical protein JOZ81_27640 [Chloroflexi bacterium]|nr:hypothetical protein [Chloroflexota bacterium]
MAILFIAPIVAAEVFARRPRRAVALALSVAPFVAWQLILSATLGQAGIASSEGQFVQPLMGMRAVIVAALHATGGHRAGWISVIAVILFVVAALVVSILTLRKRYDIFAAGMLVHAAAAIFAASSIWLGFASAARVFGGLYPLTTCAYARHRGRPLALLVGGIVALTAFTVIRFVFLMPHEAYYLTP